MSAAAVAACLLAPAPATAASSRVAALQVALRAHAVYDGTVDGLSGPGTAAGVRRFQARAGLVPDGVVGPRTRRALGALGRHPVGSRPLRSGHRGWDVAALQFALETHGFPCGAGRRRLRRPHRRGRPPPPGLRRSRRRRRRRPRHPGRPHAPPVRAPALRRPINAPIGDGYGPRGNGFHAGLDFPAPTGTPVTAAAAGRVTFAAYDDGFGLTVILDHGNGLATRYAHLSATTVHQEPPSPQARRSGESAQPAPPPAPTSTSRSRSEEPTQTQPKGDSPLTFPLSSLSRCAAGFGPAKRVLTTP